MAEPELLGAQAPRVEVIPDGDEHPRWDEIQHFLLSVGIVLDPWQLRVLWASLLRRGDMWAAFVVAVCCPRQNGKNSILEARELIGAYLLGEKLQIHSAHLADTSMEGFRRLDDVIDSNQPLKQAVKHIRRQNGHEQFSFVGGNRIRFRTRTKGGGRGFSGSPVYFDEAMYLPEVSYAAMLPVMSAQPDPQVWQMGSAVDQYVMDDGSIFAKTREEALDGHDRIAYFEWSLPYDSPDEVPIEVMQTPEAQAQTNPAYGRRISPEYVRAELRTLPARSAAVERFGVGDWPKVDGSDAVIDLNLWAELVDKDSKLGEFLVFAFDVRPDRSRAVICAIGRRADGQLHVEVVDQRSGVGWLRDELLRLERTHVPMAIVCDGVGPAASIVPELLQRNVTVQMLTTPEMGEACGMFYDAVQEKQLRHLGQPEMEVAIKGAAQRVLGDRWAWSRRNSHADIGPLVASTIGVWKVVSEEYLAPMFASG